MLTKRPVCALALGPQLEEAPHASHHSHAAAVYHREAVRDIVDRRRRRCHPSAWHTEYVAAIGLLQPLPPLLFLSSHTHIHTRRVQSPGEANEAVANDTGKRIVHWSEFYNDVVNDDVNLRKDYHDWMVSQGAAFTFCGHPYVLDAASKAFVMSEDARRQMSQEFRSSILR